MSKEELQRINQWTIDFSQAKIGLKNIEILLHNLTQGQLTVVSKLSRVFAAYNSVLEQGHAQVAIDLKRDEQIKRQLDIFSDIKRKLHADVAKFVGKCEAQLTQARSRVQTIYQNLTKYRSLKEPQASLALEHLDRQVPDFLVVFDAFLARFTLQLRWQNAEFYKQLGEAFTHAGIPETVETIKAKWWSEFQQIAQAVEALKSVHLQAGQKPIDLPKEREVHGKNKHVSFVGDPPMLEEPPATLSALNKTPTVKSNSALSQSVKWINSKVGKEVKVFKFSDPRTGFFNKPTVPPSKETEKVVGIYDFDGETESDLTFKKGDIISLVDKGTEDDPNWWCGELDGKRGLFPKNYVKTESTTTEEKHADEYIPRIPPGESPSRGNSSGEIDSGPQPAVQDHLEESNDNMPSVGSDTLTPPSAEIENEFGDFNNAPGDSVSNTDSIIADDNSDVDNMRNDVKTRSSEALPTRLETLEIESSSPDDKPKEESTKENKSIQHTVADDDDDDDDIL